MKHELTHTILESCDCNLLTFLDTSRYATAPENPILRIYPPDFDSYVDIAYKPSHITLIEATDIKHNCIPAGMYHFVQSVKPNTKTEVKCCYLNICPLVDRIAKLACEEFSEELTDLLLKLQLAQRMVEECADKASELFEMATKELEKLESCQTC